jgi:hypothetical protein
MAMRSSTQAPSDSGTTWLFGPTLDLLLGAGVAYLISVPLIMLAPGHPGASRMLEKARRMDRP